MKQEALHWGREYIHRLFCRPKQAERLFLTLSRTTNMSQTTSNLTLPYWIAIIKITCVLYGKLERGKNVWKSYQGGTFSLRDLNTIPAEAGMKRVPCIHSQHL